MKIHNDTSINIVFVILRVYDFHMNEKVLEKEFWNALRKHIVLPQHGEWDRLIRDTRKSRKIKDLLLESFRDKCNQFIKTVENVPQDDRTYKNDDLDIRSAKTVDQLIKDTPLYWIPTSVDIHRIASSVFNLARKKKDEKIRIVDVGGGIGALPLLLSRVFEKSGIEHEMIVVDPDNFIIEKARKLDKTTHISWIENTAQGFVDQVYGGTTIGGLIKKQRALEQEYREVVFAINFMRMNILEDTERPVNNDMDAVFLKMISRIFAIRLPQKDGEKYRFKTIYQSVQETYRGRREKMDREIESRISQGASAIDVVLNSWMTPNIDYTREMHLLCPKGIIYALSSWGATGNGTFPLDAVTRAGIPSWDPVYAQSYSEGRMYEHAAFWLTPSAPQVCSGVTTRYVNRSAHRPWSNTILLDMLKGDRKRGSVRLFSSSQVKKVNLPWDAEVRRTFGAGKVFFLNDKDSDFKRQIRKEILRRMYLAEAQAS